MLTVPREDIVELYQEVQKTISQCKGTGLATQAIGIRSVIWSFFGSKCLPDGNEDNFATKEPKPAKPKFKVGDRVITPERGKNMPLTIRCKTGKHYYAFEEIDYDIHEDYLEPYTEQEENVNLSQESANRDKQFDAILKDSFSKERRLHIAAMIMAAMMQNAKWGDKYSHIATISCAAADALIIEVEKNKQPLKNKQI